MSAVSIKGIFVLRLFGLMLRFSWLPQLDSNQQPFDYWYWLVAGGVLSGVVAGLLSAGVFRLLLKHD